MKNNSKINNKVLLNNDEDKITISKTNKSRVSLKNRIKNYKGPNLCKDFKWDEPIGKEILDLYN